ncbi:MAG: hypothetical protein ACFE8L_10630, partial [Candidatus Hodarchaeota archaeon]
MLEEHRTKFLERRNKFLKQEFKSSLRQILSYLWEYRTLFTIILILGFIQSILFFTVPIFLAPLLD